ncbi:PAS domain-containing protein [Methanogenium sp. S4BF]|uniref:PAS domain-containing protein n=1 Tax=Methanogenium sp. S4BF TaxID=1789226 RepID=UPI00241637B9|nr:PAS domain-containing protein [Methanogenium sp. S4BF]
MHNHNHHSNENRAQFAFENASITAGFYETLLMNANVWIAFLDPKGCVIVWNKAAEDISGYTESEVRGSREVWKKLYPDPPYREVVTQKIDDAIQNRQNLENFETVIHTKGGKQKEISWNTREILAEDGEITGYITIGRDITEVVSLGKKFRTLLMNANVWIAFLDAETRVEVWNSAAEEISGFTAEEVTGSNDIWKKLYPDPEYRKDVTTKIIDIISRTKDLENFESRIHTKDGHEKIISWNTRELDSDEGKTLGFILIGRDITKEKKLHAEIIEYIGESAMRLKNPVEVIKNNMDEIITRLENDECTTDDLILQIKIQTKNAEKIIENLYELNKAVSLAFEDMPPELKRYLSE